MAPPPDPRVSPSQPRVRTRSARQLLSPRPRVKCPTPSTIPPSSALPHVVSFSIRLAVCQVSPGTPHPHPREVRNPPIPIPATAGYPPRRLLSPLPRVRFHPYSHPLVSYYFPSEDSAHQVTPPSARQLLFSFRASGTRTPHPHPRVSYYPPFRASGMRQALPTPGPRVSLFRSCYSPCRTLGTSPLPRVSSAPTPIRSSATIFLPRIR